MADSFDLVVIGSGPGGYVAAIRAAQLGLSVGIVEKETTLGGTCLNVGCIPSKALLDSTELYDMVKHHGQAMGVKAEGLSFDLAQMMARKSKIVTSQTRGLEFLMRKNKIEVHKGVG